MDNRELIIRTLRNNRGKDEGYIADVLLGVLDVAESRVDASFLDCGLFLNPAANATLAEKIEYSTDHPDLPEDWVPVLPATLSKPPEKSLDNLYDEYAFLNQSKTEAQPENNRLFKLTLHVNKIPEESQQFVGLKGLNLCFCDENNRNVLDDYVFLNDNITPSEMLERMVDRFKKENRLVRDRIIANTPPSRGSYRDGAGGQTV